MKSATYDTYKSVFIGYVIGKFELVEGDDFGHPLLAGCRRIGMYVHPFGHFGIGFPGHHPPAVVELVATVIGCDDVHQQDVLGLLVQTGHADFVRWKYPPVNGKIRFISSVYKEDSSATAVSII